MERSLLRLRLGVDREGRRKLGNMPADPASQRNRSACQADFTYTIAVKEIKTQDTGKGAKSVADDLEAVLRKIENRHQGSIAGFAISFRDARGLEQCVWWDGQSFKVNPESLDE